MNVIEHLVKYADRYDYDVFDESELHNRIEIVFKEQVRVFCGSYDLSPIKSLIYNTEIKDLELCIEDDYGVCSIYNLDDIEQIFDKKTLFYEKDSLYDWENERFYSEVKA